MAGKFGVAFVGLSFVIAVKLCGQSGFSMEAYLRTATTDQSLEKYYAQMDFLRNNNYTPDFLNRLELRIGTEQADISLDRYRVRISPSNPMEIRANKRYHSRHQDYVNAEYNVALNQALVNRYHIIIEHYYYTQLSRLLEVRQRTTTGLLQLIGASSMERIDMDDIISIESTLSEFETELSELAMEREEMEYHIKLDLPAMEGIDWQDLGMIDIQGVKDYMSREETLENEQNIYVAEAQQYMLLQEQMFKVNKAEARSNIGYLQANYHLDQGETFNEHLGLQVGVRVPIVNPDKADLARNRFKLIESEKEIATTKTLVKRQSELLAIRLGHLFEQHRLLQDRIEKAGKMKIVSPADKNIEAFQIVKLQNFSSELQEKQLKVARDIYFAFIEYLSVKGVLAERPFRNYLSATYKTFGE